MKKKTIAALAAGGALLLAAAVIGVLSLAKGYFILTPPTHIQLNGPSEERIAAFAAYTDPDAKKYDTLTFTKVLEDQLAVMDGTAATLCRDNKLPILVFDLAEPDNIAKAVQGENVGTLVYEG